MLMHDIEDKQKRQRVKRGWRKKKTHWKLGMADDVPTMT